VAPAAPSANSTSAAPSAPSAGTPSQASSLIFAVTHPPQFRDAPGTPNGNRHFEDPHGTCEPGRLRRGGINIPAERDFDGRLRQLPQFPNFVGRLFLFYAARDPETLADFPDASGNRSVECLARVFARYPEVERLTFNYQSLFNGRPLNKSGPARALLRDGAVIDGKQPIVRRYSADEIAAIDRLARAGFAGDWIQAHTQAAAATSALPSPQGSPSQPVVAAPGALLTQHAAGGTTFSVSDYEIAAIKSDGSVEVIDLEIMPRVQRPLDAPRKVAGIEGAAWLKSNAVMKASGLGTLSLVKKADGRWMGWSPRGPAVDVDFRTHFMSVRLAEAQQPPDSRLVDVASGSNSLLWLLYDDGTVFMTASNGIYPNAATLDWQRHHRFGGVKKLAAVPWAGGSQHGVWLRGDGTVWANGVQFALGWVIEPGPSKLPDVSSRANPDWSAMQMPGVQSVVDLAVNWTFSGKGKGAAVLADGSVLALTFERRAVSPGVISSAGISADARRLSLPAKAVRAAAGGGAAGVLDEQGRVWVWGSDTNRIDMQGYALAGFRGRRVEPREADIPMQVEGLGRVVDINFGPGHAAALRDDGSLWIWNTTAPVKVLEGVRLPR
jgi:hypothetical protein